MKIKLKRRIPVEEKHGMTEGRILESVEPPDEHKGDRNVWVNGDAGERVRILGGEYDAIEGEEA